MGKTLIEYVTNNGKYPLYGLPTTEELFGRSAQFSDGSKVSFGKEIAVKCDDDLFLADKDGQLLLAEELPDESLKALDAVKATAEASSFPEGFEGWETDLCLASGYVLTALFKDGAITLSPSPEPVVPNPFAVSDTPDSAKPAEVPEAQPITLPIKIVETGEKRYLFFLPESGEIVFFNARRFLLYTISGGRVVTGYVEIPPKE